MTVSTASCSFTIDKGQRLITGGSLGVFAKRYELLHLRPGFPMQVLLENGRTLRTAPVTSIGGRYI